MRFLIPFLIVLQLLPGSLLGGVFQHLKIPQSKPSQEVMLNGVDYIYMINLDQRPEKFSNSCSELLPFGIKPYRFSAVNGWELSRQTINDVGVLFTQGMNGNYLMTRYPLQPSKGVVHEIPKRNSVYFGHCQSPGAIGIVLSHLSILQDAYNSGYETIWIMEDDIEVIQNPHLLSESIEEMDFLVGKDHWDVLFTDQDTRDSRGNYVPAYGYAHRPNYVPKNIKRLIDRKNISNNLRIVGARFGAYSMIIRRCGMKKILDFYRAYQIFLPFDMDFHTAPDIKLFTVLDDVVGHKLDAVSDNGSPSY